MKVEMLLLAGAIGVMSSTVSYAKHPKKPVQAFEECQINVEQNATDGDTEVVIFAVGGDVGLRFFSVRSPDGRHIVQAFSLDRSVMGQREFLIESPEPPGDAILAAYPEGVYRCKGRTVRNERLLSTATLSHEMPPAATILSPEDGSTQPIQALSIQWSAVPNVTQIVLELENESVDPEQAFTFSLAPDATSFEIPGSLLMPSSSYQLSIGTVSENGNKVFVEVNFETA